MDELIRKQDALDAIHCNITVTGRQNAELVATTIGAFADRIKALPPGGNRRIIAKIYNHGQSSLHWVQCRA